MKRTLILLCLFTFFSCQLSPQYKKTVDQMNLQNYMGTWYVQAGRFTPFETDVHNSIERYSWDEEKEIINIDFTYRKGSPQGKLIEMPQIGRVYNEKTNAHWKVSPFWPLQFDFLIIAYDKTSTGRPWSAIGVPGRQYLWIMTRRPHITRGELDEMIEKISQDGYPTDSLTFVSHEYSQ